MYLLCVEKDGSNPAFKVGNKYKVIENKVVLRMHNSESEYSHLIIDECRNHKSISKSVLKFGLGNANSSSPYEWAYFEEVE